MKQTAVEWFSDNVLSYKNPTNINGTDYILIPINKVEYLKEQAKEMEKEQMCEFAWQYERDCRIDLERSIEKCWEKTFNTKE